ncbi:hypothetical protein JTB14_031671 [Gonioctena quinquepunctata]|nr:hypothetical protein JTB14_031671 [Gonioctena quinquepunctata]
MENSIIFFLTYEKEEHVVELPEFDTVEMLRNAINEKFGLPLHEQMITGWKIPPEGDNTILQSCTNIIDINYLRIHKKPAGEKGQQFVTPNNAQFMDQSDDQLFGNHDRFSRGDNGNCPWNTPSGPNKDGSLQAAISCYGKIWDHCSDTGIEFNLVPFMEAVAQSCFTTLEERKVLLLYFHNENEAFSKTFFRNLHRPEVNKLVQSSFFVLGWDVENTEFHNDLDQALNEFDLSHLVSLVRCKVCGVLLIQNINGCITVNSCLTGKISDKDFLMSLENVATFLACEKKKEEELECLEKKAGKKDDMDSAKYQKLMADMLGDRDYDRFEFDQHEQLKQKIAFAMFGPPTAETGYDNKVMKKVAVVYKAIVESSNEFAEYLDLVEVSFIYNCTEPLPDEKISRAKKYPDYNPNTDLMPVPIFVLRKCRGSDNPCRLFIDDTGRTYKSWREYLTKNKLHKCKMVLPQNGRYAVKENGEVNLEYHLSPACDLDVIILQTADIVSTGAGLASGGVFLAAAVTSITFAPAVLIAAGAVGIGTGVYAIGRSIYTLVDRSKHKETLSFANSEARGAYLNIVAGSLGFVGAGANVVVSQLATNGINIGRGAGALVNTIGVANIGASGVSILNSGYDVLDQWINENQTPSLLTIVQLSSSILFFGNAVYNFRTCSTMIEEAQARTLQDYQESLRSNRHRKTFSKMMKETIRQNNGNDVTGRAEVISAIRNIQNKDEVFAALTRSNRAMNENGVKFFAQGGDITLNGQTINFNEFSSLTKKDVGAFLSNIPAKTNISPTEVSLMQTLISNIQLPSIDTLAHYAIRMLGSYDGDIQRMVLTAVSQLFAVLTLAVRQTLQEIFPNQSEYIDLLSVVMEFFGLKAMEMGDQYEQWRSSGSSQQYESWFKDIDGSNSDKYIWLFQKAVTMYFQGSAQLTQVALKELLNFFYNWLAKQMLEYQMKEEAEERRDAHSAGSLRFEVTCTTCAGHFHR